MKLTKKLSSVCSGTKETERTVSHFLLMSLASYFFISALFPKVAVTQNTGNFPPSALYNLFLSLFHSAHVRLSSPPRLCYIINHPDTTGLNRNRTKIKIIRTVFYYLKTAERKRRRIERDICFYRSSFLQRQNNNCRIIYDEISHNHHAGVMLSQNHELFLLFTVISN